jgi:hypothetical protein
MVGIMSRMNREVHVRIWKRLGVKFPRATRQKLPKPPPLTNFRFELQYRILNADAHDSRV